MIIHKKKVREAGGQLLSETSPAGCLDEERDTETHVPFCVSPVATGEPH